LSWSENSRVSFCKGLYQCTISGWRSGINGQTPLAIPLFLDFLHRNQLSAAVHLDHLCFGGFWTLEGYDRELESPNSDLLALTAAGGTLIGLGCLWAILEEAHITLLTIHPDYRQQGLGQAVLLGLLSTARRRGLERSTLEVRVSNAAAIALYEKFGFQTAGRRRRYYTRPEEDALILWRSGLQEPEFHQFLTCQDHQLRGRLAENGWLLLAPAVLESL